jgi:hypothetical protein
LPINPNEFINIPNINKMLALPLDNLITNYINISLATVAEKKNI